MLTQDVLNKAISNFKNDNPNGIWEEISQEKRWNYIKDAKNK